MDRNKKNRLEFSKVLVIISIIIFASYGIYSGMRYYNLVQLAIQSENAASVMPDPALAVACVGGILGSILTYVLYQGSLKWSLNANNLQLDQITGIVRKIATGDTTEAIVDIAEADALSNTQSKQIKKKKSEKTDIAG